jgi:hypothetical protein
MKTMISLLATAAFVLICSFNLQAQEEVPKAKKYDNPEWKRVVYVDYHNGKMGTAMKIIKKYYSPAGEKAGTPAPSLMAIMETGEYDLMIVWDMQDGVESLNWDISPNNIKWAKALEEVAGSKEKAQELRDKYSACVRSSTSELVRVADMD